MNRRIARSFLAVIRPPLVLLRVILSPIYSAVFGGLEKRLAMRNQQRLAQDIEDALPFLFNDYKGRVVPNEGVGFPPPFDYAVVTIAFDNFLIRLTRGRSELGVHVASTHGPTDWHELALLLSAIGNGREIERQDFRDLWELARELRPKIDGVCEMFALGQFGAIKQRIDEEVYKWDRIDIREWQAELNRRIYGSNR
jgi:hypothetical protein